MARLLQRSDQLKDKAKGDGAAAASAESAGAVDGAGGDAGSGALASLDEPTADAAPPLLGGPADDPSATGSVLSLLRQKKRKKRKAEEEAYEGEYVPLDPMDWRAKIA